LGRKAGEFDSPIGLYVHKDELYVVDTRNARIQILTKDGMYLRELGVDAWEGSVFVEPYILVDDDDRVWISDPTANRVLVLNQDGSLHKSWNADSTGRRFNHPMGLAFDHEKNVIVVDTHNHRVSKIQVRGKEKSEETSKVKSP